VLAGIAMLFLPCTYPMIPITISLFSKGKKLPRAQSLARALTFGAGIVISFTLVGGVIQAVLGAQGQAFVRSVATNGPLNVAIGLLFVYFALSFFGYYEVQVPEFLSNLANKGLNKARKSGDGPQSGGGTPAIALFAMGFFFCITSYTCGAPIVLAVITVGASVPGKVTVIAATAIFGATIAIPFVALALVPGALKSLPKGGNWFHAFKVVLGTVELAAALKFFSNADLYFKLGFLTRPVFLALWIVACAFIVGYVAGIIRMGHDEAPETPEGAEGPPKFSKKGLLASIPFLLATLYLCNGLNSSAKLEANLDAFLPPDPYPVADAKEQTAAPGQLPHFKSYDSALAAAQKSGRVLFLEFTGHQCVNCRKMERTVLVAPKVREALATLEAAVLHTDGHTPEEDANSAVQAEKFGTAVIPSYYLVDKDGKTIARQEGSASEEEFLKFLGKARQ
jgi:thiol:disulfide interchange protein DsbD